MGGVGKHAGGGPEAIGGGAPKCGSLTAPEGADILATDHLGITFPDDAPSVNEGVPQEFSPEPGTNFHTPKVSHSVGRTKSGKVIPHVYNPEIAKWVAQWIACGASVNEIAIYLNLRPGLVKKVYEREIITGEFENNMKVASTILDLAKAGVPQMSIFWAKSRMGWRDSDKNDQSNGAMLNLTIHG